VSDDVGYEITFEPPEGEMIDEDPEEEDVRDSRTARVEDGPPDLAG
jgi:hypothetical protein